MFVMRISMMLALAVFATGPIAFGNSQTAGSRAALGQDDPATQEMMPSGDMIARWMNSSDPRVMAWAAVFTLEEKDTSFLPDFILRAEQWRPLPHRSVFDVESPVPSRTLKEHEERDSMSALLDAIIQMNGSLPEESLLNLAADFPAQAIILLARMPPSEANSALLALYSDAAPATFYANRAAASLLALHPPPGFAASLFSDITVTSRVFVSLPDDPDRSSVHLSGDCAVSKNPDKADWPATGKYYLRDGGRGFAPEAFLTIPGLKPLEVVRIVTSTKQNESHECGVEFTALSSNLRAILLAQMLGERPEDIALRVLPDVNLKVTVAQQYRGQLATYVDREEAIFRSIKAQMLSKQLISPVEANDDAVVPSLLLVISDTRSVKEWALEALQFRFPKVK